MANSSSYGFYLSKTDGTWRMECAGLERATYQAHDCAPDDCHPARSLVAGVPTEIMHHENRDSVAPDGVAELVHAGHAVLVQGDTGEGSGFSGAEFAATGSTSLSDANAKFAETDLILKVKEPVPDEYYRVRSLLHTAWAKRTRRRW